MRKFCVIELFKYESCCVITGVGLVPFYVGLCYVVSFYYIDLSITCVVVESSQLVVKYGKSPKTYEVLIVVVSV